MFLPQQRVPVSAGLAQFRCAMAKAARSGTRQSRTTGGRIGRPPTPSVLSELRIARGLNQEDLGEVLGIQGDAYGKIERGKTRLKADQAAKLADFYGVDASILVGNRSRKIPIRGYVGAGAEVYPIDDGETFREVDCPTGLDPSHTVALEVHGDSMFPLIGEGWIIFYSSDVRGVPSEAIGQTCVVKLAHDGPTLLKHVRRGYRPNRFNLISANREPIEDAELEWAAPIRGYQAPDVARVRIVAA